MKKSMLILVSFLSMSAIVFARDGGTVSEKLLQSFKLAFPDAQDVKWVEQTDKTTVNFKDNGFVTQVDYDKDGEFMSSVRYYDEKNLPVNIICKLHKKYPGKTVFGVTERTTDSNVEYYIKLQDDKSWITVKSNSDGSLEVTEKFKKTS
jgi:hypothetical protein